MDNYNKVPPATVTTGKTSLCSALSTTDEFWQKVLDLCRQRNPGHFALEFPSTMFTSAIQYIDSGTYSHVMRAVIDANKDDVNQQGLVKKATDVVLKVN